MNLTKISPCFGCDNVAQNVDIRSSKYSRLQQTIEVAVRDPTAIPPRPTSGSRPTGWEPLIYMNWLLFSLSVVTSANVILVKLGCMINYVLYDAIHEKKQTSHESNPLKVPQKPYFIVFLNAWTWNANCSLWIRNVMYEGITNTTSQV